MDGGSIYPPHTGAECPAQSRALPGISLRNPGQSPWLRSRSWVHRCTFSRSAHTSLGQLTPGTLELFAEKLFWLLHETSSFFQPCLPCLVGAACCWAGWDAEPIHPPWELPLL